MGEKIKNTKVSLIKGYELNDSDILNDVLLSYKHLVSSYAIALNEASNKNIYKLFFNLLESSSKMQAELFELAFKKGWYQLETADENKIENTYNKFSKCFKEFYEKK
ncbi:MAG: spore coat protein [Bacilli bacterium]|nr:spore coat protein [Bacilli bacterium]